MKKIIIYILVIFHGSAFGQQLNWQLTSNKGISANEADDAWHSGRVEDMVDFADGSVLLGTSSGGLWHVKKNGESRVLTNQWDNPDIEAVERGPYSQYHIYASTSNELWENTSKNLDNWTKIPMPRNCETIRDIAIINGMERIVVGTNIGIFWSEIPKLNVATRTYNWNIAGNPSEVDNIYSLSARSTNNSSRSEGFISAEIQPTNHNVAVVSRSPVHRDVFWINANGEVKSNWSMHNAGWSDNISITPSGSAHVGSKISAVARYEDHLDVFYVSPAGKLMTTWWTNANGDWKNHVYEVPGAINLSPTGSICAVARNTNSIDVIYVTNNGAINHIQWSAASNRWNTPAVVAVPGSLNNNSKITMVSRSGNELNVFWISTSGALMTNWWMENNPRSWRNLYSIPTSTTAAQSSGIAAVSRDQNKLDVIWVSNDGKLMTTWWNAERSQQWNNTTFALSPAGAAATNTNIALVSVNPIQLDAYWIAADGTLRTNNWHMYKKPNFAEGSQNMGRTGANNITNVSATSAYDDEISIFNVSMDNKLTNIQFIKNTAEVLAGKFLQSTNPIIKIEMAPGSVQKNYATYAVPIGANAATTSVAYSKYGTCAYAIIAETNSSVKNVLSIKDGDATWSIVRTSITNPGRCTGGTLQTCAGGQGNTRNNTLAVSPVSNNIVYVGWVALYSSSNAQNTASADWQFIGSPHVHADIARVLFGENDKTGKTVFFCTDGGLSSTSDLNNTFYSKYNENLPTLQTYTTDGAGRQAEGTLGVCYDVDNLVGTGLQDNGNTWSINGGPWKHTMQGDGGYFYFLRNKIVLMRNALVDTAPIRRAEWDGTNLVLKDVVPVEKQKPGSNIPNLNNAGICIVNSPRTWNVAKTKIYAYGWVGNDLYSFWNPTGVKGWRWEYEATIPGMIAGEIISTAGSATGEVCFFATNLGRIFTYNRTTGVVSAPHSRAVSGIPDSSNYGINRLCVLSNNSAFALFNPWRSAPFDRGYVLRYNGTEWTPLPMQTNNGSTIPVQRYYAIEADWTSMNRLVLCSDDKVYSSTDMGNTWEEQSNGLPKRAHLSDIRFVQFPNGTKRFYMGSFGRSVWHANVR